MSSGTQQRACDWGMLALCSKPHIRSPPPPPPSTSLTSGGQGISLHVHYFTILDIVEGMPHKGEKEGDIGTMRFGSIAKVLAKCMLKYWRISE